MARGQEEVRIAMKTAGFWLSLCLFLGFLGCETPKRWQVTAYDLSGKSIYAGTVITGHGPMHTEDGREISFLNATIVYQELRAGKKLPSGGNRPAQ
jgi:hypothetical protein